MAPHEVRVAVRAASLNYRDLLISRGAYPAPSERPIIPCSDGSGTVLEVGADVGNLFKAGDAVVGSFFPNWHDGPSSPEKIAATVGCDLNGWLAEEIILPSYALVHMPPALSFAAAACVPCAGVTAWVALVELARLAPGQTVLIQGTGGVAMWLAQLAQAHQLHVIFVTSDVEKAARLHPNRLGAISYREHPDWSEEVLKLTDGRGADLVLEVGGNATIKESLRAVAFGGHIALVGGLGGWIYNRVEYLELITKMATAHGIYVGSKRSLTDLLAFSAENSISPHVSATFGFNDAQSAFHALEAGRNIGKIVIDMDY
ncbi:NAD(P)-dependent alcohol dehydrogenase [Herbaspirillum sp. SJZ099]|uniref:zinc-dependent alcohol dehydrogenase family protein n=1 Tax=Herbaspirillum sp. SJZ099 TaxID=2572916 RepID=UPI001646E423|nr:NAD(P)-dependent alcohol dehydrogenase [Herbaspirillum sp. SJZ099]